MDCHPLKDIIPVQKTYVHNLRIKRCACLKINTERNFYEHLSKKVDF